MKNLTFEKMIKILAILVAILICFELSLAYIITSKKQTQVKVQEDLSGTIKKEVENKLNETEKTQKSTTTIQTQEKYLPPEDRPAPEPPKR